MSGKFHPRPAAGRRHPQLRFLLPARIIHVDNKVRTSRVIVSGAQQGSQVTVSRAEAEGPKEDRRHDLARQIECLDAEIDALVYELRPKGVPAGRAGAGYELTEENIAVVEGVQAARRFNRGIRD